MGEAAATHIDLATLTFGTLCSGRLQCMIGAYFDESGTHDDEALSVAGYVSTVERWSRFCDGWTEALHEIGTSKFKATSFKSFRHDDERLIKLASVIREYALYGVVANVQPGVYNQVMGSSARSRLGSAYTFCTQAVISEVYEWLSMSEWCDDSVQFVFDTGHRNRAQAAREMTKILQSPSLERSRDSFTFGTDDSHLPLQAADLIAYQANNHFRSRLGVSKRRRKWAGFALLQHDVRHVRLEFGEEYLEHLNRQMPRPLRKKSI